MATKALVESCAIVLTPRHLRLPPSRGVHTAQWPAASGRPSLRFRLTLSPDGVPTSLTFPRQVLSRRPPRLLPRDQTIQLTTDLIASVPPQLPSRRTWFCCPGPDPDHPCARRTSRLYLPDRADTPLLLCRRCHHLDYLSHVTRQWRRSRAVAAGLFDQPTGYPLSRYSKVPLPLFRLCCAPLYLRWRLEGKGRPHWHNGAVDEHSDCF